MKSPEEIKKALQCRSNLWYCILHDCTYYRDKISTCPQNVARDALEYIQQLENHIGELTEKVAQLEAAQPKWISVAERLPEDDAEVLTHAVDCNGGSAFAITSYTHHMHGYNIEGWCSPWQHFHNYYIVTHWMPLPVPPEYEIFQS